jgi:signal transduction histidine kinase
MRRAFSRLRWQLTFSHLIAIAVTLVCMIAAALLIVMLGITLHSNPRGAPAADARSVAGAVGGFLPDGDPAALNGVLHALANGNVGVVREIDGPPWATGWTGGTLEDIAYITVIGPDGRVLGSSGPAGAAPSPEGRDDWETLIAAVEGGERNLGDLVLAREGATPAALGAYPVIDAAGRPVATVIVAKTEFSPAQSVLNLWRAVLIFLAATVGVLAVASIFALASAGVVAYLLSRRLVARLERLGAAVDSLAVGDLSRRVEEGPDDEVGQLGRQINRMAADLERTLHDLQAERDRVTGLLEARRQLVAGVSHELRTPVATIRGYLESAVQPNGRRVPEDLRADLETMEREVVRLQNLIEDLFTLSRTEVGRLALRVEPVDAGAIVCRLTETVAPLAWGHRRVQVVAEVTPGLPPARADSQRLEQIVSNLLSNAVRHTPPGGLVATIVSTEPAQVRIEVRDTGEGIALEDLPHIFERYYRGRNNDQGGAGLGLALVKELTVAMDGTVEATSTPGEGSCFTVRLPLA